MLLTGGTPRDTGTACEDIARAASTPIISKRSTCLWALVLALLSALVLAASAHAAEPPSEPAAESSPSAPTSEPVAETTSVAPATEPAVESPPPPTEPVVVETPPPPVVESPPPPVSE
ncbi:MAG: hypothetical protein QOI03_2351, partial [Solirubrobacteraceae bacterium]|nr:hypothetical protein [Solirubrobacteraceae bacterium]